MGKKDRMLEHIKNNVDWLMTTSTEVEVIPYYELSQSVFNKVRQYIASDAEYSDVVCLISTSILETGKSGVLFTTDYVYSKAWGGILTKKTRNSIFLSAISEFDSDIFNEFDSDRMIELMSDLADISLEEDEEDIKKEERSKFLDKVSDASKVVGEIVLGGMALLDIVTQISDESVCQNNEMISDQMHSSVNSDDLQDDFVKEIYSPFLPLVETLSEISSRNEEAEEIGFSLINVLNEILLELHRQANKYLDISPDDENYENLMQWLAFWAFMFCDSDKFKSEYQALGDMPELWNLIVGVVDSLLEDEGWDVSFSSMFSIFGYTVGINLNNLIEIDWDDEESIDEIIELNNQAIHILENALGKAIGYLSSLLSNGIEE